MRASQDLELAGEAARAEREEYLAELTRRLQDRLSPLETFEQVSEIRSHLDSMAGAYVEMGTPPEQAMRSALAKFGAADQVGRIIADSAKVAENQPSGLSRGLILLLLLDALMAIGYSFIYTFAALPLAGGPNFSGNPVLANAFRMSPEGLIPVAIAIGAVTWSMPQVRPLKLALISVALFNVMLPMVLYRTLGTSLWLAYVPIGHSIGVFAIALSTVYAARALRKAEKSRRTKGAHA